MKKEREKGLIIMDPLTIPPPPPVLPHPPLGLRLKLNKNKLTGKVHEFVTDRKTDIENGVIMGDTFSFQAFIKVGTSRIPTTWQGVLKDSNTLSIRRFNANGQEIDDRPVEFHRAK
jgi:hypothetical protein